ncbi:hypothetical protein BC833DRAFT_594226 [Globomyces pollinis-pini]|nr:hypothetical protein BC833DRAFT_594226 [Globomyces pollinis-pini]
MALITPAVRQSIPFLCFIVGSAALSINLAHLQKLKHQIQELEVQNADTLKKCHELELEKLKLEANLTASGKKPTWF